MPILFNKLIHQLQSNLFLTIKFSNFFMEQLNQLKNLVIQSLQTNGSLSNIRAQIRSSVFKVIDTQQSNNPKKVSQFHWENLKVQKLAESKEGHEQLSLIKQFFQLYNMDYTLNIFNSQSNLKEQIKREQLANKFGIKGKVPDDKPLLFHMFQNFMVNNKPGSTTEKKNTPSATVKQPEKKVDNKIPNFSKEKESVNKAQQIVKKNETKTTKIADLPAQKKGKQVQQEEVQEQIIKNESKKFGQSQVYGESQGYDMSVDSLQLEEYDYFQNIAK